MIGTPERIEFLTATGRVLFGERWQRPMARALGAYNPDGAQAFVDDRLMRRWVAGERVIPDWVFQALGPIMDEKVKRLADARCVLLTAGGLTGEG